ncbi:MAG: NTP transferase domain-containing protein, partial [Deltaproteobacteria bacterium]|nr:NTP transferase domain-containing protein [Deltaproteobacteria bacterium]
MKGVIVAAGYGTRFLPLTRVIPKEMLPILDRPAVDWVVRELAEAGVDDLLVVTSRRKRALEDWFDRDPELEAVWARGDAGRLARIRPPDARVAFVRQPAMGGTGDAILLARSFVGDEPFVVAFPDDLFLSRGAPGCAAELVAAHRETGGSVLSSMALPETEETSRYGILDL